MPPSADAPSLGVQDTVTRGVPSGPGAAPAQRSPDTAMWGASTIVESALEISRWAVYGTGRTTLLSARIP